MVRVYFKVFLSWLFFTRTLWLKAFEREVDAHRAVDHPSVLALHDVDVVTKGTYKEARMLVTYYKVQPFCKLLSVKCTIQNIIYILTDL